MTSTSLIELDQTALEANYAFLRKQFGDTITISSVVKGNAYGHGIEYFIPMAESCGVRHFSVFSAEEAYRVQKSLSTQSTIMIMGDVEAEALEWAIENEIECFVFDVERLEAAAHWSKLIGKKAHIHIEIETGMNRTGFAREEWPYLVEFIKSHEELFVVEALCTHFAGSESIANYVRIADQQAVFNEAVSFFASHQVPIQKLHACCSAASIRYPHMRHQLVRIGIMQYGFWPSREIFVDYVKENKTRISPLQRLITWKSRVMTTKKVQTGEFVGYGTTYLAQNDMEIAIIPVGYAYGFSRSLSNTGRVLIRGTRLQVIGIVNMNSIAVDITGVTVEKGDEVVLIGHQDELEITVASFGELSEQLNYELLTRIPKDIPRIITRE